MKKDNMYYKIQYKKEKGKRNSRRWKDAEI